MSLIKNLFTKKPLIFQVCIFSPLKLWIRSCGVIMIPCPVYSHIIQLRIAETKFPGSFQFFPLKPQCLEIRETCGCAPPKFFLFFEFFLMEASSVGGEQGNHVGAMWPLDNCPKTIQKKNSHMLTKKFVFFSNLDKVTRLVSRVNLPNRFNFSMKIVFIYGVGKVHPFLPFENFVTC